MSNSIEKKYLQPTKFLDSDSPAIIQLAQESYNKKRSMLENAVTLYYKIRDSIRYKVYDIDFSPQGMTASATLERGSGFCIQKSVLMAAAARAMNIPSRLGFADVRNHLTSDRLQSLMKTDIFLWHGYTELYLEGKWVKATPVFNLSLCEKFGVKPLEFDGKQDSIFHESNEQGKKHMEYLNFRGEYDDLPYDEVVECFRANYSFMLCENPHAVSGNFEEETLSN